jgi:hypothetical protein
MKEQIDEALAELGGEPLDGSGFEAETDDKRFSGAVLLRSTFVPDWSTALRKPAQSPRN